RRHTRSDRDWSSDVCSSDLGAGGLAVGVHTTQFAIREPNVGLFKPVLELAAEELSRSRRIEAHSAKSETRNPKSEIRQSLSTKPPAAGTEPADAGTEFHSWEGSGVGSSAALHISAAGSAPLTAVATIGIACICGNTKQAAA